MHGQANVINISRENRLRLVRVKINEDGVHVEDSDSFLLTPLGGHEHLSLSGENEYLKITYVPNDPPVEEGEST